MWKIRSQNNISDLNGNTVTFGELADICATYSDRIDGISILDVALYEGNRLVAQPEGTTSIRACIRIYNSADNKKECSLVVYTDEEEQNLIYEETILLNNGITETVLNIPEREYLQNEGFFVRIK